MRTNTWIWAVIALIAAVFLCGVGAVAWNAPGGQAVRAQLAELTSGEPLRAEPAPADAPAAEVITDTVGTEGAGPGIAAADPVTETARVAPMAIPTPTAAPTAPALVVTGTYQMDPVNGFIMVKVTDDWPWKVIPGAVVTAPEKTDPPGKFILERTDDRGNHVTCLWDVPFGLSELNGKAGVHNVDCVAFELEPGVTVTLQLRYATFPYVESRLGGATVTHDTYAQLFNCGWKQQNCGPAARGVAFWGVQKGTYALVQYDDGPICKGTSFQIVPGVDIKVNFVNEAGSKTNAKWGQGQWGPAAEHGVREPDVMYAKCK
ncbi:hypothetical protein A2716_01695 [candidate division WWE3 bacterium RIFCSPHIGHO2_01_FULL_40_23]|uniref:Uncharacterized protein n=1 Tax=candidate division WWE3 bacterium RIFCSPLOWO2_01_FULL_41_18 TaxID=1802625 RepID=A0A1F4VEN8_UNCKA|nr:MAG: hypothetical protein A2716_01695 [candidate division WWE3 bacterium RIFCSPHIGHO2_01_FULL_40_23]OGC55706.1 MAG: hypothetical protein A3A78_01545 [candidate division WWE3 bacterium RIFCSPLOWO2_01_FULL_41_18]